MNALASLTVIQVKTFLLDKFVYEEPFLKHFKQI